MRAATLLPALAEAPPLLAGHALLRHGLARLQRLRRKGQGMAHGRMQVPAARLSRSGVAPWPAAWGQPLGVPGQAAATMQALGRARQAGARPQLAGGMMAAVAARARPAAAAGRTGEAARQRTRAVVLAEPLARAAALAAALAEPSARAAALAEPLAHQPQMAAAGPAAAVVLVVGLAATAGVKAAALMMPGRACRTRRCDRRRPACARRQWTAAWWTGAQVCFFTVLVHIPGTCHVSQAIAYYCHPRHVQNRCAHNVRYSWNDEDRTFITGRSLTEARLLHADGRWARDDFPWSADLAQANHDYFGNSAFRPNQREAINATLSRQDCFVLMPTGGGAPAVLLANSAKTMAAIFGQQMS